MSYIHSHFLCLVISLACLLCTKLVQDQECMCINVRIDSACLQHVSFLLPPLPPHVIIPLSLPSSADNVSFQHPWSSLLLLPSSWSEIHVRSGSDPVGCIQDHYHPSNTHHKQTHAKCHDHSGCKVALIEGDDGTSQIWHNDPIFNLVHK